MQPFPNRSFVMIDILLVEDNTNDEELTVHALDRQSFAKNIQVVHDGAEALEYLFCTGGYANRQSENPKLVLLDLKLPSIDGIDVLRQIRADPRTQFVPVVVFTSSNDDLHIFKSYALGANSYIVKPGDVDQFNKAINHLAFYWLVLNRQPVHMPSEKPLSAAVIGDQIAIIPTPPSDVQEIQTVDDVGPVVIGTEAGLVFAKASGVSLNDGSNYAVIATDEHRAALKEKASR
jgi:two-component system, response regulator